MQRWDLDSESNERRRCQHCGNHVSENFRQTFGVEGVVHRCPECSIYGDLPRRAAGLEARPRSDLK